MPGFRSVFSVETNWVNSSGGSDWVNSSGGSGWFNSSGGSDWVDWQVSGLSRLHWGVLEFKIFPGAAKVIGSSIAGSIVRRCMAVEETLCEKRDSG